MSVLQLLDKWDRTSFHLGRIVFYLLFGAAGLFLLSYFWPELFNVAIVVIVCTALSVLVDFFLLYRQRKPFEAQREIQERLSNGDENKVVLHLRSHYDFPVNLLVIDELPMQFQERNWKRTICMQRDTEALIVYTLTPVERGEYAFGNINLYAEGPLRLVRRRITFPREHTVKVYPSYVQMRRYQLMMAIGTNVQETGVKRMRKLGHSMEFEQIKEYVRGDDYRTVNWKATARRGDFMVNSYTDERSQQIYCLVNKGRVMKMPFEGMTLLDHAINSALVISSVALQRQDKAGLITFGKTLDAFVPADKKPTQINNILETLYRQQTGFGEPDFEKLFSAVRNRITQRSLLILFTNFESIESLERELPSLKRLAHYHLLMVVFFENTELKELTEKPATTTEEIYIQTIANKFRHEKQLIVKELQKAGIIAVLSTPQQLTINALNKYLELKNRSSI